MAWTLDQVTEWVVGRREQWLARADLSILTTANPDVQGAITLALMDAGYAPATPLGAADGDLAAVPASGMLGFLMMVDLRVLETIQGNYSRIDEQVGPQKKAYSQFMDALAKEIAALRKRLTDQFGFGRRRGRAMSARIQAGRCWPPNPPVVSETVAIDSTCTDVNDPYLVP